MNVNRYECGHSTAWEGTREQPGMFEFQREGLCQDCALEQRKTRRLGEVLWSCGCYTDQAMALELVGCRADYVDQACRDCRLVV
jgi:hypothetical protein